MPNELIFMFQLIASAIAGKTKYPAGERHAIIILSKQPGPEADHLICHNILSDCGWDNALIDQVDIISDEQSIEDDPELDAALNSARENGSSIIVYTDPIKKH